MPFGFAMQGKGQGGRWFGQGALVSGQGGHSSSSSFTGGYPSFTYPPRWGSSKGGFKGKGGRGTKGVLPSATPPCHAFLPKAETKNEVVEATCPTTSTGPHTTWCALPVVPSPPHSLQLKPCHRSCADQTAALQVLEEYKEVGAVEEISLQGTQFLVSWFVIRKREGEVEKLRLISDCREINQHL